MRICDLPADIHDTPLVIFAENGCFAFEVEHSDLKKMRTALTEFLKSVGEYAIVSEEEVWDDDSEGGRMDEAMLLITNLPFEK